MTTNQPLRLSAIALAAALSLGLAACGKKDDQTAGQKLDSTIAQTQQAAADAKATVKDAAADAKAAADKAAADAKVAADQAGQKVAVAADKASDKVAVAADQAAAKVDSAAAKAAATAEEAAITASVNAGLVKDPDLSAIKIDVDTKGDVVTLHGSAPSTAAKARATDIAKAVKGVRLVNNMLTIKH